MIPFNITLKPSERSFQNEPGQTLLASALEAGIPLPYGCKDGACGSCKCKLLEGEVTHGPHQVKALSAQEEQEAILNPDVDVEPDVAQLHLISVKFSFFITVL